MLENETNYDEARHKSINRNNVCYFDRAWDKNKLFLVFFHNTEMSVILFKTENGTRFE